MRDLLSNPAWQAADLGIPLPDDKHAVSVCLPTWESVLGYEENLATVTSKLQCGYPRFFRHPILNRLLAEARETICTVEEDLVIFPNREAAQRAQFFVEKRIPSATRISSYEIFQCLVLPREHLKVAQEYWRYTGEIICSRAVEDFFNGTQQDENIGSELLQKLAHLFSCETSDLYLYENGMAATFAAFRAIQELHTGKKTLQVEFPYVDTLKIQQNFGSGVVYLNEAEEDPLEEALIRIRNGEFAAVFCEIPSNPLLRCPDLKTISEACKAGGVILIVDDTVASHYNVDVTPYADVICTSLTKWISGKGDAMAGSVRVNPNSPFANSLRTFLNTDNPSHSKLYSGDATVILNNSNGFEERMSIVNRNALHIAQLLDSHPAIESVWYPKLITTSFYESLMTKQGGYGGLISFSLKNSKRAPKVFDNLPLSKGPSLGTEFSLACPYTLLAHYDDLEWVENCGVPTNLIRISIGVEPIDIIESALYTSLKHA